jgi:Na+/melibiose symporter-like transporter
MRIVLSVIGILLILVGVVWILQGFNVLPGSFMTGQIQYTYWGLGLAAIGVVLLATANRSNRSRLDR